MHPPLDRPHPHCEAVIRELKDCHKDTFKKFTGGCNDIKVALDQCFKREKKELLEQLNADVPENRLRQEDMIKEAFGKKMTFQEYLSQDRDYQEALRKKNEGKR
jgi:COX assembly mitochondrial protein 2